MLKSFSSIVAGTTIFILHFNGAHAFWRLLCDGSVGLARIDPLTNFGTASEHVHSIKGGSAFSPDAQSAILGNSKCSSCNVKQDNSVYWAPALYFMNSDDNTVEVVPEKPPHKSYYFLNTGRTSDGKPQKIEAFPPGFQVIVGSNRNRNTSIPNPDPNPLGPWSDESQDVRAQRALGFNCLNYAAGLAEPSLSRHFLPDKDYLDKNCADGIRLELMFPSCWNGELDGGKNHKSHVAFPDGVMVGDCPAGYDRRLVSLFYETIVATDLFKGKNGKFVFSNGDPTGFGYHGDFIEAWKPGVLQDAIDQCTNLSGRMEDCPVFQYNSDPGSCALENPLPAEIASEDVKGPRPGLPNRIQVQPGPELASPPAEPKSGHADPAVAPPKNQEKIPAPAPTTVVKIPTVPVSDPSEPSSTQGATPPAKQGGNANQYVQQQYSESPISPPPKILAEAPLPSSSIPAAPPAQPAPTNKPDEVPAPVALRAGEAVTTTYWTSGREAHEVIVILEEVTITADGGKVTKTDGASGAEVTHYKRQHQQHQQHHQHHAGRGIGGRKMMI